jgi:hypothetical protein
MSSPSLMTTALFSMIWRKARACCIGAERENVPGLR